MKREGSSKFAAIMLALSCLTLGLAEPVWAQSPGGLSSSVQIGGTASNRIGSTDGHSGSSQTSVSVGGKVTTVAPGGKAETVIGDAARGGKTRVKDVTNIGGKQYISGNTSVTGSTTTMPNSDLKLGGCGSTNVMGDVFVGSGSLEIGCVCAGRRNGMCCIVFHNALCVINQVPPGKHGCPPRYIYSGGLCRLYSDFAHALGE